MKLEFFCPWWGLDHLGIETMVEFVADSGFDGIETFVPIDPVKQQRLVKAIDDAGLAWIAHRYEAEGDMDEWCAQYAELLRSAAGLGPRFINSHTGRDHWASDAVDRVLNLAFEIEAETEVTILHETHRSRFPYSAAVTATYLERYPELRLTADLSHWACVSESLLEDQDHHLEPALARSDHIHARVGWAQGAQVPDVRHPRWEHELAVHVDWWKRIQTHRRAAGSEVLTITTEFGPPPYTPVDIESGEPLNDFRELDRWIRDHLKTELADAPSRPTELGTRPGP